MGGSRAFKVAICDLRRRCNGFFKTWTPSEVSAVYAFTEQGVAMLSGILRSKRGVQVNVAIMRVFVKLREILLQNKELAQKLSELEQKIEKHDEDISAIFEAIRRMMAVEEKPKRQIGFYVL